MTCRATAVDSRTGEVRWRRRAGPDGQGRPGPDRRRGRHHGPGRRVLPDRRQAKLPTSRRGGVAGRDERWLVAQPARGFTAYTGPIPGPNNSVVAVLTNDDRTQILVRRSPGDSLCTSASCRHAGPAGRAARSSPGQMLTPAAGGRRPVPAQPDGPEGPARGRARPGAANGCRPRPSATSPRSTTTSCSPPTGPGRSSAGSGRRATSSFNTNGRLELRRAAGGDAGRAARLAAAARRRRRARATLTMIDGDKLTLPALQTWKPGGQDTACRPARSATACGWRRRPTASPRIAYTVDGRFVWLSPDADSPEWVGPAPLKASTGRPVIDGKRHPADRPRRRRPRGRHARPVRRPATSSG